MNSNPVLHWTDHAGERQAMPVADVKREFEQFLQWRAQQAQPAASGEPAGFIWRIKLRVEQQRKAFPGEDPAYLWKYEHGTARLSDCEQDSALEVIPLYATAQPAPAPACDQFDKLVAELDATDPASMAKARQWAATVLGAQPAPAPTPATPGKLGLSMVCPYCEQGFTAVQEPQPAPALVPLTDAQIDQIKAQPGCWEHVGQRIEFRYRPFARTIEAAHGIAAPDAP